MKEELDDVLVPKVESDEMEEVKEKNLKPSLLKKREANDLGLKHEPKEEKMEVEEKDDAMEIKTKVEQGCTVDGMADEKPMNQEPTTPENKTLRMKQNHWPLKLNYWQHLQEDEEEKMDEDDTSEKSSQAEGEC